MNTPRIKGLLLHRARPAAGGLALLTWREEAMTPGNVLQLLIDGRLQEVIEPGRLFAWVQLPGWRVTRVGLRIVDRADAWVEPPDGDGSGFAAAPGIAIHRPLDLPVDGRIIVKVDGQERGRWRLWENRESRTGFGAQLGLGGFGFDDAGAEGFGIGEWGAGSPGIDGFFWCWRLGDAAPGEHQIDVQLQDSDGAVIGDWPGGRLVNIEAPPPRASRFQIGPGLSLQWLP